VAKRHGGLGGDGGGTGVRVDAPVAIAHDGPMQPPWPEIGLVLLLILINAGFAGSEVALISLREGQLRRLEREGRQGRLVAWLARDPNQFLSTIQIGITLAGFLASAAAAVSLAEPLVPLLDVLGGAAEPVAVVLVTMVLTYLTLVVGELAPKRIALQSPERWALRAARPLAVISTLTRPAVWLLSKSTDLLVRLAGADPGRQRQAVTEEEVRDMIATGGVFRPDQRRILAETIEIGARRLSNVLVARREVVAVPADASVQEAIDILVRTTHGRAPVYRGDLDDVIGLVTLQDLVGAEGPVADHVRRVLALPESMGVLDALRRLQAEREQLAIVINEYGGTEGIITVEDLLEELVGEIYDEFDPDSQSIQPQPDGSLVLPGSFPVHDLPDLGVSLPEGDYATVAGLVLERLGRIPDRGETVDVDRWRLEVLEVDRNAITQVRLVPLPHPSEDGLA
jgi:putative hemolysin